MNNMKQTRHHFKVVIPFLIVMLLIISQNVNSQNVTMSEGVRYDIEDGRFFDPGGINGDYDTNLNITQTLCLQIGGAGVVFYISFEEFYLGYGDTLFIYDGADNTSPLLGAFTFVNSPGTIIASSGCLTFHLVTDNVIEPLAVLNKGWIASMQYYNSQQNTILMNETTNQTEIYTCNSKFYDSGGPTGNISGSQNYTIAFTSEVGTHVKMEFISFNVSGTFEVYDGNQVFGTARLIGTFTTTNPPPVLFSSGTCLSVHYNGSGGAGWNCTVSCVQDIFVTEDGSACPEIRIAQIDSNNISSEQSVIYFDCNNPNILLEANVSATGLYTNDYTVESIPYNPPFEFNSGTVMQITTDDVWGSPVTLPFTFSFFGQNYTSVYPSSNGVVSLSPQSGYCSYSYSGPPYNYTNCIYGVYEDIDCRYFSNGGAVRRDVMGEYPCRAFVINYMNVGLYGNHSSPSNYNTYQIVMYEGTNIIDVYVQHRACCATTNGSGEGIIGLQNPSSSQVILAPGRGMTSWTADNEAWRFTPITPVGDDYVIKWYRNSVSDNNTINTGDSKIVVVPNETTKYIASLEFTSSSGDEFFITDTVLIIVDIPPVEILLSDHIICPYDSVRVDIAPGEGRDSTDNAVWSTGQTNFPFWIYPDSSLTINLTAQMNNGCYSYATDSISVFDLIEPHIIGDTSMCQGEIVTLTVENASEFLNVKWNTGEQTNSISVSPIDTTIYSVLAQLEHDCSTRDTFTLNVFPLPIAGFAASPSHVYVENGQGVINFIDASTNAAEWLWNFGDSYSMENSSTMPSPTHIYTRPGNFEVSQLVTSDMGCTASISTLVTVEVPYFFYIPNSFSPNGDGINEYFYPQGEGVDPEIFEMQIYDRFGKLQFRTDIPYDYWDGRTKDGIRCPIGEYVYVIKTQTLNGDPKEYIGTFSLIR